VTSAGRLVLLTREECGLCEEFLEQLQAFGQGRPLPPLAIEDVDADAEMQRRYGLHVPVLLLDGERVCAHRFDPPELERLLRRR
jgi:hypothetical protein